MFKYLSLLAAFSLPAAAQQPADAFTGYNHDELVAKGHDLLKQAESAPSGSYSVTLDKFKDHFTMLAARTKSGGGEFHGKYADIFVIVEGEATEITGGTLVDRKEKDNGEAAGVRVEGGTPHVMRAGDIVHIAAGTPHQTTVAPGAHVVYFVVKVAQ